MESIEDFDRLIDFAASDSNDIVFYLTRGISNTAMILTYVGEEKVHTVLDVYATVEETDEIEQHIFERANETGEFAGIFKGMVTPYSTFTQRSHGGITEKLTLDIAYSYFDDMELHNAESRKMYFELSENSYENLFTALVIDDKTHYRLQGEIGEYDAEHILQDAQDNGFQLIEGLP